MLVCESFCLELFSLLIVCKSGSNLWVAKVFKQYFLFSQVQVVEEFLGKDDEIIEVVSLEGKLLKIQGRERTSRQEVSDCAQKGDKT